jgi:hypothetical protein
MGNLIPKIYVVTRSQFSFLFECKSTVCEIITVKVVRFQIDAF